MTPTPPHGTDVTLAAMTPADVDRFLAVDLSAFFLDTHDQAPAQATAGLDWARTFGASRAVGEGLAGVYTSYDMRLTVPGPHGTLRQVPMPGLSWVAVHPDHRRRGVLRAMMRHHFAHLHESGLGSISGLHAAEVGIYGRFGYGVASLESTLELGRGATLTAPAHDDAAAAVETRFEPVDSEAACTRMLEVQLRAAAATLGSVTRPEAMHREILRDVPAARRGEEPRQVMFARADGLTTGFAVFKRRQQWSEGSASGSVTVDEIAATDPATLLALARRLVDFDLTTSISIHGRGPDDDLVWWAGGPRVVRLRSSDSLWVRLVDVGAALSGRGCVGPVDLVLDVADELCPWNAGRWRLTADAAGEASCVATEDAADLRLPVQVLGAAYLGSNPVAAQSRRGLVEELSPGAVRALSRAMRADTEPSASIGF